MSYPTMNRAMLKLGKPAARRLLEHSSAWSAHRMRKCLDHCWYCNIAKRLGAHGQDKS
jgi:hypothetical protein